MAPARRATLHASLGSCGRNWAIPMASRRRPTFSARSMGSGHRAAISAATPLFSLAIRSASDFSASNSYSISRPGRREGAHKRQLEVVRDACPDLFGRFADRARVPSCRRPAGGVCHFELHDRLCDMRYVHEDRGGPAPARPIRTDGIRGRRLVHTELATSCGLCTPTRKVYGDDSGPLPSPLYPLAEWRKCRAARLLPASGPDVPTGISLPTELRATGRRSSAVAADRSTPGSRGASSSARGGGACAMPWPRSGGCARG